MTTQKYVNFKYLDRVAKRLEKSNLKKYRKTLTWVSMLNRLNQCIVCIDIDTILIDTKKLQQIKNELVAEVANV